MQGLFDLHDCSLSLPEQLGRIGVAIGEGFIIASLMGMIGVGGGLGLGLSLGVSLGAAAFFFYVNELWLFPYLNQITLTPTDYRR